MAKAQITLFIIIGMIVLLATMVTIMLFSRGKQEATEEAGKAQLSQSLLQPVKDYVTQCLSLTSENALLLLGQQGLRLTQGQGSTGKDFPVNDGIEQIRMADRSNVSYLVQNKPEFEINTVPLHADTLPKPFQQNFMTNNHMKNNEVMTYYPWRVYPQNPFPDELPGVAETLTGKGFFGWNVIPNLDTPREKSVAEMLEAYINSNIQNCTKWETLERQGLDAAVGMPETKVIMGEADTSFKLSWPITVTHKTSGAQAQLKEFTATHAARLKSLWQYTQWLIDQDVVDPEFDIKTASTNEMKVFVSRFGGKGSVVEVKDERSRLRGEPYTFRFARINRAPAMFWVNQLLLNQNPQFLCQGAIVAFTQTGASTGELKINRPQGGTTSCAGEPETLITINAVEPDEDPITLSAVILNKNNLNLGTTAVDDRDVRGCAFDTRIAASDGFAMDWQLIRLWFRSFQAEESPCRSLEIYG